MCADSIMYQYFVKIVPTAYVKIDGQVSILLSGVINMLSYNECTVEVYGVTVEILT